MYVQLAPKRSGLTLPEVVVVLAIMVIVLLLLWPALMGARERNRRKLCEVKLGRLMLAVQNYESAFGAFPAGVVNPHGPIQHEARGQHHSWIVQLLPFLDQQRLFEQVDPAASVYADKHAAIRQSMIPTIVCPSYPREELTHSSYAGCHDALETAIDANNSGVFYLNSNLRQADIVDGLEYTLFVSEKRATKSDLGWMSGTRATLRNTGVSPNRSIAPTASDSAAKLKVGGFGSYHSGIVFSALGSGAVTATSNSIDPHVYQSLGRRNDRVDQLPEGTEPGKNGN